MKTKKINRPRLFYPVLILLFLLPAIGCKKNNTVAGPPVSVQTMATVLEGEVLNGSISTEADEEGLALWCNGGKILIGIAKMTSKTFTDPGNIEQAEVVYSNFGIIIRDAKTNWTWYYIQNDAQSRQHFNQLPDSGLPVIVSGTEGTVRLNIS